LKKWMLILPLFVVIILITMVAGYRFTALSAAKSNSFVTNDFKLIEKYDTGSSAIFLFKSDAKKEYRTVLSEKSGLLYRSSVSTYIKYSSDKLQTVGGISFKSENDGVTFLSIISNNEEVAYIEAGIEPNIERKEINKGQRISFLFPFSEQLDFLNPTAFDKNGKKLYYYGFPKDSNILKSEEFKWHKMDE